MVQTREFERIVETSARK